MEKRQRKKEALFYLACLILFFFLAGEKAVAQTTLVTLEGMITDEHGSALPGAALILKNIETGYTYSATSRPDGRYIVSGIQPGKYEIEVSLPGFQTQKRVGLIFNVGARLTINFSLAAAALEEEVTVTAASPMVEVTRSEVSKVIDRSKIEDLPLLDRNFGDLAMMKAGVQGSRSNALPAGSEEIIVDGVSNEWVGTNRQRSNIPADAIQEFRVITNQYQAEYGNSSGMVWTAITRSGTNEFRGRLSFFYRDEAFDDVNYFVNHATYQGPELPKDQWTEAPYSHYLFGGVFGGPIIKDKAHFFISYEGMRHEDYALITSPLVPKEEVPRRQVPNQLLAKLNYQLSEKHLFSFRYTLDAQKATNQGIGGLLTKERGYDNKWTVHEGQGSWIYYPSDNSMNEFRFLYSLTSTDLDVYSPGTYTVDRPSGYFGKYASLPQGYDEKRLQFNDSFSLFLKNHNIKIGVDYSMISLAGYADQYIPGYFVFLTDKPFNAADFGTYPLYFVYNKGVRDFDYPYREAGIFVQDTWRVHRRLSFNLGLRWNYYDCKDIDLDHGHLNHLNPRFGFSWDPIGDGKTSVRGGVGRFTQNPILNIGLVAGLMAAMDIRTIFYPGYPDPFSANPFVPPIPGVIPIDKYGTIPGLAPPTSTQMTLGAEREILSDFSLGVDFVWTRGRNFTRLENFNPIIPGTGNKRKDPTKGNQYTYTDNGRSDYRAIYFTLTKRFSHGWALDISYTLSESKADVETEQTTAWSYDDNAWERQYGYTNNDARHRIFASWIVNLPFGFQLSGLFSYNSKTPWTPLYATDVNKDSLNTDYVDWNRNSRRGFDFYTINLRLSKHITISRFRIQVLAEAYNVTNRVNFSSIYARYGTANFGNPLAAANPRQIQFGARLDF
ncbi:MAG: TonB-dependent receptor [Clostridiales bacterium]|nr:TonB-dependent receptor [Clostridiales bacterium]